jgi:hypothetical protein
MTDVFLLALALCALTTLLIIHPPWRRRRAAFGERLLELCGKARDVDPSGFTLVTPSGEHRIQLEVGLGARLPRPREGSRVSVCGVAAQRRADESLYRDSGISHVVDAVDLTKVWRERTLRVATVAVLALCMTLAGTLYLRERTPLQALIAHTAEQIACPAGTERVTLGGAPRLFTHYCRDPAGNKHGPYGVWTYDGRLRERGSFRRGVRNGTLIEVDPPLFHRKHCAFGGAQRASRDHCPVIARVSSLDAKGRAHGVSYGYYYPRRQKAFVGTFRHGRRVGTWSFFHPKGHQLYAVEYADDGDAQYSYYDERTGARCRGGSDPSVRWQLAEPDERCTIICSNDRALCRKPNDKPPRPRNSLFAL